MANQVPGITVDTSVRRYPPDGLALGRRRNPAARGTTSKRRFDHLLANLDEVIDDSDAEIDFDGDDPGDIHVNAAAVASGAHKLLTMNGRDFGDLDLLPYEIYTPDQFFCLIDDGADACVRRVTMEQVTYWNRQRDGSRSTKPPIDALGNACCPNSRYGYPGIWVTSPVVEDMDEFAHGESR